MSEESCLLQQFALAINAGEKSKATEFCANGTSSVFFFFFFSRYIFFSREYLIKTEHICIKIPN